MDVIQLWLHEGWERNYGSANRAAPSGLFADAPGLSPGRADPFFSAFHMLAYETPSLTLRKRLGNAVRPGILGSHNAGLAWCNRFGDRVNSADGGQPDRREHRVTEVNPQMKRRDVSRIIDAKTGDCTQQIVPA